MSGASDWPPPPSGPLAIGTTRVRGHSDDVADAAWDALRTVCDPELCLDVVSLGLVYRVRHEAGTVVVEMTLTTPGCPVSESLPEEARVAVQEAVGLAAAVEVQVVWDPPWSPAMMDDEAASLLGFRRR